MTDAPFELRILGPTELGTDPGLDDANLRAPKRLALLAYLALATADGFRRRDQIVGYFWPELGQEAARAQLRKAMFALRESLGEVLVTRGEGEVRLDTARVWCDAVALYQLNRGGRSREALALYRGELLEGLFVEGVSPEFQEWLDDQRRALREQAALAAWQCSTLEEERGDRRAAAVAARRALELTPDDEDGVRRLMSLLDRQGDRGGALRAYTDWQARLLKEYGVEPAPETRKLARRVQSARKGESHETPPTSQQPVVAAVRESADEPAPPVAATRRTFPLVLAGAAALLIVVAGAIALARAPATPFVPPPRSLAVLPLRVIGDSGLTSVAEGVAEELTTALVLDSALTIRTATRARDALGQGGDIDRLGRKLNVSYVVDGAAQQGAGRIRVTLRLVRTADAVAVWAGTFDMEEADRLAAARRVATEAAQQIRAKLSGAP